MNCNSINRLKRALLPEKKGFGVIASIVAYFTLSGIFVLLPSTRRYESTWIGNTISLNALIAILSTIFRACIVSATEEVMNQFKWTLFQRPTPVQYLTHFDAASRGPWGSLLLLFETRKLSPAHLGCIVMVSSLAIGPFSQQALSYVPCGIDKWSSASISVAYWMHHHNTTRLNAREYDLDIVTKVAILDGLVSSDTARSEIVPTCSSGNCTFGSPYVSVGICRRCVNVLPWMRRVKADEHISFKTSSNSTKIGTDLFDYVLPDGTRIRNGSQIAANALSVSGSKPMWNQSEYEYNAWNGSFSDAFRENFTDIFTSSIFNVSTIAFTEDGCVEVLDDDNDYVKECATDAFNTSRYGPDTQNIAAASCSFYPCVREYLGDVKSSKFNETTIAETPMLQPRVQGNNSFPNFSLLRGVCNEEQYTNNNQTITGKNRNYYTRAIIGNKEVDVPLNCTYGMHGIYAHSLANWLHETMVGDCNLSSSAGKSNTNYYNSSVCAPWPLKGLAAGGNATFESIDANMQSIALAITKQIRQQGYTDPFTDDFMLDDMHDFPLDGGPSAFWSRPGRVNGEPDQTGGTCPRVVLKWLIFPSSLFVLAFCFVVSVENRMVDDKRKTPYWGSSILPLLFAGDSIGSAVNAGDLKTMIEDTKKMKVSLSHNGTGWEFVEEKETTAYRNATWEP